MHVFITGGSGQTGPSVVSDFIAAGHQVSGLARSDASAAKLERLGASAVRGSLDDPESLTACAAACDGVVHMAFGGDFADAEALIRRDVEAIETLGRALAGSGKPFVSTSGTLVLPAGRVATELDEPDPESLAPFRIPGEQACLGFAAREVRSAVVRLAPTVHGSKDHGFVPVLIAAARRNGRSAYVGDGRNRWPAVHRADAANLFRLALERAPAGSVLHGVGERAVTMRSIAEVIGRALEIPTVLTRASIKQRTNVSLDREVFSEHVENPFLARAFALDAPVSSDLTRTLLGWEPDHPTLLEDLRDGDYFDAEADARVAAAWSS